MSSLVTTEAAAQHADSFVVRGPVKEMIHAKDPSGFLVRALVVPHVLPAARMIDSGLGTATDIGPIDRGLPVRWGHSCWPT